MSKSFPAIGVVGPRQSGKTTLIKDVFPNNPYVLLKDSGQKRSEGDLIFWRDLDLIVQ